MESREFVHAIKQVVRDDAVSGTISVVERPPGRQVAEFARKRADWYQSLSNEQKRFFISAITDAVDSSIFGLFCVLDGVRAVEDRSEKGKFELRYVGESTHLLNAPDGPLLHDIYNESARPRR